MSTTLAGAPAAGPQPAGPQRRAESRRVQGRLLDPRTLWRNPVMLIVEVGAVFTIALAIRDRTAFGWLIVVWLWLTVLFANLGGGRRGPRQGAGRRAAPDQDRHGRPPAGRLAAGAADRDAADRAGLGAAATAGRPRGGRGG